MGHKCQSHSCTSDSCCTGSSCSQEQSSAKCGCNGNCCSCCPCRQGKNKYADQLLHLADEAWMELLKEKIKEEIRLNGGEQITNLAKLVSSANHARWKEKMQAKREHEDFETQLKNLMCGCNSQKR